MAHEFYNARRDVIVTTLAVDIIENFRSRKILSHILTLFFLPRTNFTNERVRGQKLVGADWFLLPIRLTNFLLRLMARKVRVAHIGPPDYSLLYQIKNDRETFRELPLYTVRV